jgi:hypothetical protein
MRKLKVLSAAITLDSFTVATLARLTGQSDKAVRYWIEKLVAQGHVEPSGATRISSKGRALIQYRWAANSRVLVREEVAGMLPATAQLLLPGSDVEKYEDPFLASLSVAEQWADAAEATRDEKKVRECLAMATAEIETSRAMMARRSLDDVQRCETMTRRLERLAGRPPIEALRSKITRVFREAFERASQYVSVDTQKDTRPLEHLLSQEFALVLNGAEENVVGAAREVERTMGQIGRGCIVLEMAQVSRKNRRRALEALGPVFTGPGSAAVKVFIILSTGAGKSHNVMEDVVSLFGDSDRFSTLMHGTGPGRADYWADDLQTMFLATTSVPSDDWLPRGIAKQALLHTCLDTQTYLPHHEMAKLTLNDPVIVDVVSTVGRRRQNRHPRWSHFSYHVAFNHAVIRGLVIGSFSRAESALAEHEPEAETVVSEEFPFAEDSVRAFDEQGSAA